MLGIGGMVNETSDVIGLDPIPQGMMGRTYTADDGELRELANKIRALSADSDDEEEDEEEEEDNLDEDDQDEHINNQDQSLLIHQYNGLQGVNDIHSQSILQGWFRWFCF